MPRGEHALRRSAATPDRGRNGRGSGSRSRLHPPHRRAVPDGVGVRRPRECCCRPDECRSRPCWRDRHTRRGSPCGRNPTWESRRAVRPSQHKFPDRPHAVDEDAAREADRVTLEPVNSSFTPPVRHSFPLQLCPSLSYGLQDRHGNRWHLSGTGRFEPSKCLARRPGHPRLRWQASTPPSQEPGGAGRVVGGSGNALAARPPRPGFRRGERRGTRASAARPFCLDHRNMACCPGRIKAVRQGPDARPRSL